MIKILLFFLIMTNITILTNDLKAKQLLSNNKYNRLDNQVN